jgi:uncharacterized membrane protein
MATVVDYPLTHQGVRNLDNPVRPSQSRVNVGPDERSLSKLGGAVLVGVGAGQGGLIGLTLAAIGGSLIYRGMTGHCSAYAAMGVNTAR